LLKRSATILSKSQTTHNDTYSLRTEKAQANQVTLVTIFTMWVSNWT